MRSSDDRTGELFSYVDLDARVARSSVAGDPGSGERSAGGAGAGVRGSVFADRAAVDPAGEAAAGNALAGVLLDPLRAALDGAAGIRPSVPLVVGIGVDDAAWDHSVFSKNRDRLLEGDIAAKFLAAVLAQPKVKKLLSTNRFSADGTLIEAWASMKSIKPKDGSGEPPAEGCGRNAEANFHRHRRSKETHASTSDPDARLYRKGKGKEAKLCFIGHGLMENRSGLLAAYNLARLPKLMAEAG